MFGAAPDRLSKLPAELRNRIWEHVLIDDHSAIDIDANSNAPPAVLAASRQIRKETRAIYYTRNHFVITVYDYDAAAVLPFIGRYLKYSRFSTLFPDEELNVEFAFLGQPNWKNLYDWIKAEWDRGITGIANEDAILFHDNDLINGVFMIKRDVMAKGCSWEVMAAALPGIRMMLGADDGDWRLDYDEDGNIVDSQDEA